MTARQAIRRQKISFKFVRETISELKKVVWPTRLEARNLTTIVIVVSAVVGAFLGTVDFIFYWIINELILKPR